MKTSNDWIDSKLKNKQPCYFLITENQLYSIFDLIFIANSFIYFFFLTQSRIIQCDRNKLLKEPCSPHILSHTAFKTWRNDHVWDERTKCPKYQWETLDYLWARGFEWEWRRLKEWLNQSLGPKKVLRHYLEHLIYVQNTAKFVTCRHKGQRCPSRACFKSYGKHKCYLYWS